MNVRSYFAPGSTLDQLVLRSVLARNDLRRLIVSLTPVSTEAGGESIGWCEIIRHRMPDISAKSASRETRFRRMDDAED